MCTYIGIYNVYFLYLHTYICHSILKTKTSRWIIDQSAYTYIRHTLTYNPSGGFLFVFLSIEWQRESKFFPNR